MKKYLKFIIAFVLLVCGAFFGACTKKNDSEKDPLVPVDVDNISINLSLPEEGTFAQVSRTKVFSQDLSKKTEIDFLDIELVNGTDSGLAVLANVAIKVEKDGQDAIEYSNWFNVDEQLINTANLEQNETQPSVIGASDSGSFCLENLLLGEDVCTTYSKAKITTKFTFVVMAENAEYNVQEIVGAFEDELLATYTLTLNVGGVETEYTLIGGSSVAKALDISDVYDTYNEENTCGLFVDSDYTTPIKNISLWKDTTLYTRNATTEGFSVSEAGELIIEDSSIYSGEVCLPAKINGVAVKTIPTTAFKNNTNITKIVFPTTLKSIGQQAFRGCNGITEIFLPEGVEILGDQAFALCAGLTDVFLPNGLTTIEQNCFRQLSNLANINLPNTLQTIGMGAFAQTGLTSVILPSSLQNMGSFIFRECSALETAVISEGITTIPYGLFFRCSALEDVALPEGITEICEGAFNECISLEEIDFPSTLVEIKMAAFQGSALKNIVLPEGFKTLGIFVFDGCSKLKTAQLPNTLEEIGKCAFQECTNLEQVNLPSSLKFIGNFGFNHCHSLQFSTIVIPASVVQLGGETFVGDNEDNDIIGSHMFYDCAVGTLTAFEVEEGNTHFTVRDGVLYTKNLKYLVSYPAANTRTRYEIEEGCEMTYELAFSRAHYLETLKFPNSFKVLPLEQLPEGWVNEYLSSIDGGLYVFNSISAFEVNEDNPNFKVVDGILYSKDGTKLISVPTRKWDANRMLYFSEDMTTIDTILNAVNTTYTYNGREVGGCPSIIVLSANVTNVRENAFLELPTNSVKIFTEATARPEGWAADLGFNENRIYYYSETEQEGNYWHYVDGVPTEW